jgi:hypothetical protein
VTTQLVASRVVLSSIELVLCRKCYLCAMNYSMYIVNVCSKNSVYVT